MKKKPEFPTISERIDRYLATVPRSRPWYNPKERRWEKGWPYITRRAVFAIFQAHRRARALQAMAKFDAEIAREKAAERKRLARKRKARNAKTTRKTKKRR